MRFFKFKFKFKNNLLEANQEKTIQGPNVKNINVKNYFCLEIFYQKGNNVENDPNTDPNTAGLNGAKPNLTLPYHTLTLRGPPFDVNPFIFRR